MDALVVSGGGGGEVDGNGLSLDTSGLWRREKESEMVRECVQRSLKVVKRGHVPTSVLVAWSFSKERLIKTTLNPRLPNWTAKAFPIPSVHPVTTATVEKV